MAAPTFLISIDVGTVLLKAVALQRDLTGRQWVVGSRIAASGLLDASIPQLIEEMEKVILAEVEKNQDWQASYDLVLVGHPPDLEVYGRAEQVARYSHEEALRSVAERQSADGVVLFVDVGSHRTMAALAKYGKVSVESWDFGVGQEAWDFLQHGTTNEQLSAWLPFDVGEGVVTNYVAIKNLYPEVVPTTTVEHSIEQSMVKMMLRQVAASVPVPWQEVSEVVISGGPLSQPAMASQSVATFLDGLQPVGSCRLLSDQGMMLYALGGAFDYWSRKDFSIGRALLQGSLVAVADVLSLNESNKEDDQKRRLAKITLDAGLTNEQVLEIRSGEVAVVPWSDEVVGEMMIKDGPLAGKKSYQVAGGQVGLVIDGRARPILLSTNDRQRRIQLLSWDKQLNVHGQVKTLESVIEGEQHG